MEKLNNVDRVGLLLKSSFYSNLIVLLNTIPIIKDNGCKFNLRRSRDRVTGLFPKEYNLSRYNGDKDDVKVSFNELMYCRDVLLQLEPSQKVAVVLCGDYRENAARDLMVSRDLEPIGYQRTVQLTMDLMMGMRSSGELPSYLAHAQRVLGVTSGMSYSQLRECMRDAYALVPLQLFGATVDEIPSLRPREPVADILSRLEHHVANSVTSSVWLRSRGRSRAVVDAPRANERDGQDEVANQLRRYRLGASVIYRTSDVGLVYGPGTYPVVTSRSAFSQVLLQQGRDRVYVSRAVRACRLLPSDDPSINAELARTQVKLERVDAVLGQAWDGLGGTVWLSALPVRVLRR